MAPERITPNLSALHLADILSEIVYYRKNGFWRSGVRVGVIFEGGALRGVLSCGYGLALSYIIPGCAPYSVYGSSSGALNAVYYATDQLDVGLTIYADNATDPKCTNIWRFPNVLNPDWLIDEWMFDKKSFDITKIKGCDRNVWISLTNLHNGNAHYINARDVDAPLLRQAMKATCYAPLVSNGYQTIGGQPYGDGAVADSIAYDRAIDDGCTHIICLLTRPPGYVKKHSLIGRALVTLRLLHHERTYLNAFFERDLAYTNLLDRLYRKESSRNKPTMILHPAGREETPSALETKPAVIAEKGQSAFTLATESLSATGLLPRAGRDRNRKQNLSD